MAVSERMGYSMDADYAFGAPGGVAGGGGGGGGTARDAKAGTASSAARAAVGGERAAGCVWLADASLTEPLWQRVRPLLPQKLGGGELAGLNARWRLYRYDQGTGARVSEVDRGALRGIALPRGRRGGLRGGRAGLVR